MSTASLSVKNVAAGYGKIRALHGVSLEVAAGNIVALLGANGAGKTTTLKSIVGLVPTDEGTVEFDGRRIEKWTVAKRVKLGLAMVPESREVFSTLTVEENLRMGAFTRPRLADLSGEFDLVYQLFGKLKERRRQVAGTLSGGEQQQVAVGRALMSRPRLLLLDEPSLGLAPQLLDEVYDTILRLRDEAGLTILLVEQNASMALAVADFAYVLESGVSAMDGPADELAAHPRVRSLYLGD